MKITLAPILWAKDEDKKGECPIAIRISGGGTKTHYNTKIKCPATEWNGIEISENVIDYDIKNEQIKQLLADARREILNRELQRLPVTLEDVKAMFTPTDRKTGDFLKFYRAYIDNLIAANKQAQGTIAIWETHYTQLETYSNKKLPFRSVNAEFLNKYHEWLAGHKKKYKPTTIYKMLKSLVQIVHAAINQGKVERMQISGFKMPRYQEPHTDYLTLEQVRKIENELYGGKMDSNPTLRLIAAYFLLECHSGIRWSDWGKFEVEKLIDNRNFKVMTTKNKQPIYLDLSVFKSLDKIVTYIADNKLVYNLSKITANHTLKGLQVVAGINFPLTTHHGRRTYGTLLGELGYSTRFISEAMGITETTAKRYVKITRQGLNAEMTRIGGL